MTRPSLVRLSALCCLASSTMFDADAVAQSSDPNARSGDSTTQPWAPPGEAASDEHEPVEGEQPGAPATHPPRAAAEDDEPAAPAAERVESPAAAFLLRARLPLAFGQTTVIVAGPRLAVGARLDRIELTLGVGLSFGSSFEEITTAVGTPALVGLDYVAFTIAPGIAYVLAQSSDRMSRLHLGANIFIGTDQRDYEDGTSTSATLYGGSLAFGGEHRLASMFGLGAEAGFGILLVSGSVTTATADTAGMFAAIFATVYSG